MKTSSLRQLPDMRNSYTGTYETNIGQMGMNLFITDRLENGDMKAVMQFYRLSGDSLGRDGSSKLCF